MGLAVPRKPSSVTVTWWIIPCHSRTGRVPARGSGLVGSWSASMLPVAERRGKHPVEFLGGRPGEPAVQLFLPRVRNAERQNVTAQRRGWLLGKLFCPQCPQLKSHAAPQQPAHLRPPTQRHV
jgi:hypothetical protein